MAEKINLLKRVSALDTAPTFLPYSKVVIHTDEDTVVKAGNDTGRTLEMSDPFATPALAERILARIMGFQYQPYYAQGALLDPAAEIGDAVSVKDVYGGIYQRTRRFDHQMQADIAAPHDEEINHEYAYETPTERKFRRQLNEVRASLIIEGERILAEVVKKEDGAESTFGWNLNATSWNVYSGGKTVLSVDKDGLEVAGTIRAGTKIGSGSGFVISAKAIYNNIPNFGGSQSDGVYLGTDGIQLGQNFTVNRQGTVTASSIRLKGTITFLNADGSTAGTMSAANLRLGASRANAGHSTWNGTSAAWDNATGTSSTLNYFSSYTLRARSKLIFGNYDLEVGTLNYKDHNGSNRTATLVFARR